jgi:hypothetical protein
LALPPIIKTKRSCPHFLLTFRNRCARNGEEFLLLPDDNEIRLISMGGLLLSKYC